MEMFAAALYLRFVIVVSAGGLLIQRRRPLRVLDYPVGSFRQLYFKILARFPGDYPSGGYPNQPYPPPPQPNNVPPMSSGGGPNAFQAALHNLGNAYIEFGKV
eukprot:756737-Hanusia_phi.AAC.2